MADGDPKGVFRRGHLASLYRRRFSPYVVPPPVVSTVSFSRHHLPVSIQDTLIAQRQLSRRKFSPLSRKKRAILFTVT